MLRLILNRDITENVGSVEEAANMVVNFIETVGMDETLFIGGQVYDGDKKLVAVVNPDGEIFTEDKAGSGFWKFHTLALQSNVGGF